MNKITTDSECLDSLRQGNPSGLAYIIRIYFPVLRTYSLRIIDDTALAEDITEEAIIKVWELHHSFQSFNELKGFLYTTVRNRSLNALRDKERERKKHDSWNSTLHNSENDELVYEEMLAEIRKGLQKLTPKLRQIFILSYYKKMSNQEIATMLQLSEQTVRNQKSQALLTLRKLLSEKTFSFLLLIL